MRFVAAKPDELQIDIDSPFYRFGIPVFTRSKSGNVHVTVKMPASLGLKQRIILAAALGDDTVRVNMNMKRARNGSPHPVLFLEK